jgi:ribonuclease P protein component
VGACDYRATPQEGAETADDSAAVQARGSLTSEGFGRHQRLAVSEDIRRVLTRGRRHRAVYLDILWEANQAGHPRLGLIVPKYQSSAVARNRLRRRLKELWRRSILPELSGFDFVVRVRPGGYSARPADLTSEVLGWLASKAPRRAEPW